MELVFELLAEGVLELLLPCVLSVFEVRLSRDDQGHQVRKAFGYLTLGVALGLLSTVALPQHLIGLPTVRFYWLFAAPVAGALSMGWMHALLYREQGRADPWRVWPFVHGALFAGALAVLRFACLER